MSAAYLQTVCARVREQVSLELDGELSQLEQRMLGTHLERCARCEAYAADVRDVTERIRTRAARRAGSARSSFAGAARLTAMRLQVGVAAAFALAALGLGTQLAMSTEPQSGSLARFEGRPNLNPPRSVLEQEQAILRVVRPGRTLPPRGSVI